MAALIKQGAIVRQIRYLCVSEKSQFFICSLCGSANSELSCVGYLHQEVTKDKDVVV